VRQIGSTEAARERVIQQALRYLEQDTRQVEAEASSVRHRLGEVQGRIKNLVNVLAMMGKQGVASVKEELEKLEVQKAELRTKLDELTKRETPRTEAQERARRFAETWKGVGDILDQATPDEQRLVLQHYVEVIELRATGTGGKSGTYALQLSTEVGPLANPFDGNGIGRNGEHGDTPVDVAVLTDPALVRRVGEKAPRVQRRS
jgi:cell division protein FtsB